MQRWCLRGSLIAAFLTALVWAGARPLTASADQGGFEPLFNGKDFTGFQFVFQKLKKDAGKPPPDPGKTWWVKDGVIFCTGHPNGYIHTEKRYKNYIIRYDWQYARPEGLTDDKNWTGNSGCLVHIHQPHKVWPRCVEVQGMNRDHGLLIMIPGAPNSKLRGKDGFDRAAKDKAVRPVGEWNTTEITCRGDGSILVLINGQKVNEGNSELTEGQIGFQSEGAEIHFRNILLKQLPIQQ
jgi:hypothetical protein